MENPENSPLFAHAEAVLKARDTYRQVVEQADLTYKIALRSADKAYKEALKLAKVSPSSTPPADKPLL